MYNMCKSGTHIHISGIQMYALRSNIIPFGFQYICALRLYVIHITIAEGISNQINNNEYSYPHIGIL